MRDEYDFSKARRGAVIPSPGKTRITIMLDDDIIEHFRTRAEAEGLGYQTLINALLRTFVESRGNAKSEDRLLTAATLRRVLREELPSYAAVPISQSDIASRQPVFTSLAMRAEALSARAGAVTVRVYPGDPAANGGKLIATGLLVVIGQARFLITAGHVLDDMPVGESAIAFNEGLSMVTGVRTRWRAAKPGNDKFDVGVVRLSGPSWELADASRFLSLDEIALRLPLSPRGDFAFIGYPATKQPQFLGNATLRSFAYRLLATGRPPSSYDDLGYDPNVNVLLGFNKRRVWTELGCQTAPDLFGMSGGGIWHFDGRLAEAASPPRLAGVGILWLQKTKDKAIVATRIDQIVKKIVEGHPDLRSHLDEACEKSA